MSQPMHNRYSDFAELRPTGEASHIPDTRLDDGCKGDPRRQRVVDESCTCPDWQQRSPEGGCKHLRRVDHEIKRGQVPRPDGRLPANADVV